MFRKTERIERLRPLSLDGARLPAYTAKAALSKVKCVGCRGNKLMLHTLNRLELRSLVNFRFFFVSSTVQSFLSYDQLYVVSARSSRYWWTAPLNYKVGRSGHRDLKNKIHKNKPLQEGWCKHTCIELKLLTIPPPTCTTKEHLSHHPRSSDPFYILSYYRVNKKK